MSTGSWDRSQFVTQPDSSWIGRKHYRSWNGSDRQFKAYPKASLVSVDRAQAIFDDLVDENRAESKFLARQTRREARKAGVNSGLATSGNGFFHYGKREGDKPPKRSYDQDNPYSMSEDILEDSNLVYRSPNPPYGGLVGRQMHAFGATSWATMPAWTANDQLRLIRKLGETVRGSDFNAGVFLGELHEAFGLVGDSAIRIARSLRAIKRGDLAGSARSLFEGTTRAPVRPYRSMQPFKATADRVSANWLELQLGWLPLLSEAHSAGEFIAHQLNVPLRKKYKTSIRKETSTQRITSWVPGGIVAKSTGVYTRWLTAVYVEKNPNLSTMYQLDPASVAWQLVPLSFVSDWFIPFGSWLEARAASSSLNCDYHVLATKTVATRHPPEGKGILSRDGRPVWKRVTFTRQVIQGNPQVPIPEFTPLSEVFSVKRCLTALALVTQAFVGDASRFSRPLGG